MRSARPAGGAPRRAPQTPACATGTNPLRPLPGFPPPPQGIDKPNIRRLVHWGVPSSLESYFQQAGRAGRDGLPARCTLLWSHGDFAVRRGAPGREVALGHAWLGGAVAASRLELGRGPLGVRGALRRRGGAPGCCDQPPCPHMRVARSRRRFRPCPAAAPPPQKQDFIRGQDGLRTAATREAHQRGQAALQAYCAGAGCRHAALVNYFQPGASGAQAPGWGLRWGRAWGRRGLAETSTSSRVKVGREHPGGMRWEPRGVVGQMAGRFKGFQLGAS